MADEIPYSESDIDISPLTPEEMRALGDFSCGSAELDDFFHNEVELCAKYHYLSPYKCTLVETGEIVGLFTLANDVIALEYEDKVDYPALNPEYDDIFRRQPTYPAVNIGHLAVRNGKQSKGIGRIIVEFVYVTFSQLTVAGCQFVTVDALNNPRTLNFYTHKLGFEFQTVSDIGKHTRRMYLDLIT